MRAPTEEQILLPQSVARDPYPEHYLFGISWQASIIVRNPPTVTPSEWVCKNIVCGGEGGGCVGVGSSREMIPGSTTRGLPDSSQVDMLVLSSNTSILSDA